MTATKVIDTQTLSDWLKAGKNVSILDIRPLSERAEWHIPQSIHVNVYDGISCSYLKTYRFLLRL